MASLSFDCVDGIHAHIEVYALRHETIDGDAFWAFRKQHLNPGSKGDHVDRYVIGAIIFQDAIGDANDQLLFGHGTIGEL